LRQSLLVLFSIVALAGGLVALAVAVADRTGGGGQAAVPTTSYAYAAPAGTASAASAGPGDPAAGKAVFASAGCTSCHTLADAGSTGNVGPNLDGAKPSFDRIVDRVANGRGVMPPFKDQLSDQQIKDVATYISSVAGK
jgi:mono/diheme cytochrome c family protein